MDQWTSRSIQQRNQVIFVDYAEALIKITPYTVLQNIYLGVSQMIGEKEALKKKVQILCILAALIMTVDKIYNKGLVYTH
jgi:hypothetical protein